MNESICEFFRSLLLSGPGISFKEKPIARHTAVSYCAKFRFALKEAYSKELLAEESPWMEIIRKYSLLLVTFPHFENKIARKINSKKVKNVGAYLLLKIQIVSHFLIPAKSL